MPKYDHILNVAHRGGPIDRPENTFAAFDHAPISVRIGSKQTSEVRAMARSSSSTTAPSIARPTERAK